MKITVPATSANIGPGFDSVGVALSKYLTIEVLGAAKRWEISHDLGDNVPTDEENLLVKTALKVEPSLAPQRIRMVSDIPLARGLGSSSSVIVAGIELANQIADLQLSAQDKLKIAVEIEGHPDNVAPAIFGNLVVASYVDGRTDHIVADFPDCDFIAFIPNYELKTSDSRDVLPETLAYKEAVAASSIANVAVAALLKGQLETAGHAIQSDKFHERYRQQLVKEFSPIKAVSQENGAYATYLSGAGPTIMTIAPRESSQAIVQQITALDLDGELAVLSVDPRGVHLS
ncbi:homoserine kinase [Streptococcus dentasini]